MYYYVYSITCDHPESRQKYYYGFCSCRCLPKQYTALWSSSKVVQQARQWCGTKCFRKKIIAIFTTREEVLAKEIQLHSYFNLKNHSLFFNGANQTSLKFVYTDSSTVQKKFLET